jgi:hypothetical protein
MPGSNQYDAQGRQEPRGKRRTPKKDKRNRVESDRKIFKRRIPRGPAFHTVRTDGPHVSWDS